MTVYNISGLITEPLGLDQQLLLSRSGMKYGFGPNNASEQERQLADSIADSLVSFFTSPPDHYWCKIFFSLLPSQKFLHPSKAQQTYKTLKRTVFENDWKSLIQHCTMRAKRATFTFWVDKSAKMVKGAFLKTWSLLSNSVTRQINFKRTTLVENAKIEKSKWDILVDLQTMCCLCPSF